MNRAADTFCCPLCGGPNDCQMCATDTCKGPCWCAETVMPADLLARVPAQETNNACICRACVLEFHREQATSRPLSRILPGDFYMESGLAVFTAAYLLRRGYCCGSRCRHCPYGDIGKRGVDRDHMENGRRAP